jgi:hypothetical protein
VALYTYTLHLVRKRKRGSLLADLESCGGIVLSGEETGVLLGRSTFYVGEVESPSRPTCPLPVVTLELDNAPFEEVSIFSSPATCMAVCERASTCVDGRP